MHLPSRFESKIDKSGECWIWTAGKDRKGYGRYRLPHGHIGAHRFMWIALNGPVAAGLEVCHNCPGGDNPACVRPEHLWVGTHGQNMSDKGGKGRGVPPPRNDGDRHWTRAHPERVKHGANAPAAKFPDAVIADLREARLAGASLRQLSRRFGMSVTHVSMVVRGQRRG